MRKPPKDKQWKATDRNGQSIKIMAHTWFDARDEACKVFGCGPDELEVVRDQRSSASKSPCSQCSQMSWGALCSVCIESKTWDGFRPREGQRDEPRSKTDGNNFDVNQL